jgi:uncharacterized membrane protein
MPHHRLHSATGICAATGKTMPASRLSPLAALRPVIAERIRAKHPELAFESLVCDEVVNAARLDYVRCLLEEQLGDLTHLDEEVVESLQKHEVLSVRPGSEGEDGSAIGVGERLADRIATFGGSWKFILAFSGFLVMWILANAWMLASRAFDPYPFILLNLILSCVAALQAPVIMMSQNRQEARDRLRAENDYKINLKAELEIRHLHEKVDYLLHQQATRLMEVQQIQLDLMRELAQRRASR